VTDVTTETTTTAAEVEDLEGFRHRLRGWLKENLPPAGPLQKPSRLSDEEELAEVEEDRHLQRLLYDGGFAGLVFPKEYGGAGLTPAHQEVLNDEIVGYSFPRRLQVPGFVPCAALINEFGTEEQKREHLPKMLRGEEVWMQMLSEPSSGSDVAGALTTAVRDGDEWILNGSKIWTSGAWWADWALCLVRTNWDVPKHRGLSVFMLKIHQPGIEVQRIEMLDGSKDFCQEFITDVRIPDSDRIGDVDAGWTVGTRWMFLEKTLGVSPYVIRPKGTMRGLNPWAPTAFVVAKEVGRLDDPVARQLVGEAHALKIVGQEGLARIGRAISARRLSDQGAGMSRVIGNLTGARINDIIFELAGSSAVVWEEGDDELGDRGVEQLLRQMMSISGGSIEMSRNGVSERFLGMPREASGDYGVPFRDVPRGSGGR
jgi:alkylation response protein AidB-like acyl-CoA dehydrogenase